MDENRSSGIERHEKHICHQCGWAFPNPHPSARHRRAHKKICGTIEGFKLINSEEKMGLTPAPKSPTVCSIKGQELDGVQDNSPQNITPENTKSTNVSPTSTTMDPEVNYTTNSIGGDKARDHEKNEIDTCDDISGNESREGTAEENLQMNTKAITSSARNLSESEVVVKDGMDEFMSNRGIVNGYEGRKFGTCSELEEEFAESSQVSDSDMLQKGSKRKRLTLRDLLLLPDDDDESFVQSAAAVNDNHARKFSGCCSGVSYGSSKEQGLSSHLNASTADVKNPSISTDSFTLSEADKEKLKNSNVPLEVCLLDKLNNFEPSFREIFEPSSGGAIPTISSQIKAQQKVKKPNWIDNVIAKVTTTGPKKKQTPMETILSEADVKGILESRLGSERKKSKAKQKPSFGRIACFPFKGASKAKTRRMADRELQLQEYTSAW